MYRPDEIAATVRVRQHRQDPPQGHRRQAAVSTAGRRCGGAADSTTRPAPSATNADRLTPRGILRPAVTRRTCSMVDPTPSVHALEQLEQLPAGRRDRHPRVAWGRRRRPSRPAQAASPTSPATRTSTSARHRTLPGAGGRRRVDILDLADPRRGARPAAPARPGVAAPSRGWYMLCTVMVEDLRTDREGCSSARRRRSAPERRVHLLPGPSAHGAARALASRHPRRVRPTSGPCIDAGSPDERRGGHTTAMDSAADVTSSHSAARGANGWTEWSLPTMTTSSGRSM